MKRGYIPKWMLCGPVPLWMGPAIPLFYALNSTAAGTGGGSSLCQACP